MSPVADAAVPTVPSLVRLWLGYGATRQSGGDDPRLGCGERLFLVYAIERGRAKVVDLTALDHGWIEVARLRTATWQSDDLADLRDVYQRLRVRVREFEVLGGVCAKRARCSSVTKAARVLRAAVEKGVE